MKLPKLVDLSQAGTLKLGQTELKTKKKIKKKIKNSKAMNQLMAFASTNTLTYSLMYLTDGSILPQQGEDLG